MINVPIFKRSLVQELHDNVEKNLEFYEERRFDEILGETKYFQYQKEIESCQFNPDIFASLRTASSGESDVRNAFSLFQCFDGMTPYLATDERVWTAIIHKYCIDFAWKRHVANATTKEAKVKQIKAHFFCRGGQRGIHRNNTLSSLWWWGYIASQYKQSELSNTLNVLLQKTDFREAIVSRPTLSRVSPVFNSVIEIASQEIKKSDTPKLFERKVYREWFKQINRHGGVKLYANMNEKQLVPIFKSLLP